MENPWSGRTVLGWNEGEPILLTPFQRAVEAAHTGGHVTILKATMPARSLVRAHTHEREDEFTFVYRGTIGARVGKEEIVAPEGSLLFKPRNVQHAMWNATNLPALMLEIITPSGLEGLFAALSEARQRGGTGDDFSALSGSFGVSFDPELSAELEARHRLSPTS